MMGINPWHVQFSILLRWPVTAQPQPVSGIGSYLLLFPSAFAEDGKGPYPDMG